MDFIIWRKKVVSDGRVMKSNVLFFIVMLVNTIQVENRIMPLLPATMTSILTDDTTSSASPSGNHLNEMDEKGEKKADMELELLKTYEYHDEYTYEAEKKQLVTTKKPCAVVVLSNLQNPNVQSLLRKYRYDANGLLIPSSVQYFIKFPQGVRQAPLLVPLNNKAFSPLGGFVRYYKAVPPIPRAWKR